MVVILAVIINTMGMTISCSDADDSDNGDNNSHQADVISDMRYAEKDIIRKTNLHRTLLSGRPGMVFMLLPQYNLLCALRGFAFRFFCPFFCLPI